MPASIITGYEDIPGTVITAEDPEDIVEYKGDNQILKMPKNIGQSKPVRANQGQTGLYVPLSRVKSRLHTNNQLPRLTESAIIISFPICMEVELGCDKM